MLDVYKTDMIKEYIYLTKKLLQYDYSTIIYNVHGNHSNYFIFLDPTTIQSQLMMNIIGRDLHDKLELSSLHIMLVL